MGWSNHDTFAATCFTPLEPEIDVDLEWAFSYRSQDCRDNVRFSASGNIIYHSAAVGIVLTDESTPEDSEEKKFQDQKTHTNGVFSWTTMTTFCVWQLTMTVVMLQLGRFSRAGPNEQSHVRRSGIRSCRLICTLGGVHQRSYHLFALAIMESI